VPHQRQARAQAEHTVVRAFPLALPFKPAAQAAPRARPPRDQRHDRRLARGAPKPGRDNRRDSIKSEKDTLAIDGVSKRSLTLAAGQERRVSFGIQAHAVGRAQLLFTARLGQGTRFQDAVRLPLEVQSEPAIVDHIAMSGTLPGGAAEEIPVRLPEDAALATTGGAWHLRLARGFESDLEGALRYLASYRYACAEQTASTLLPLLLFPNDPVLATQGKTEPRAKARLARLEKLKVTSHRPEDEGGIDFWPGSRRPDLFATAWALLVLSHAPADTGAGQHLGHVLEQRPHPGAGLVVERGADTVRQHPRLCRVARDPVRPARAMRRPAARLPRVCRPQDGFHQLLHLLPVFGVVGDAEVDEVQWPGKERHLIVLRAGQ
jgi:hypothetical protein